MPAGVCRQVSDPMPPRKASRQDSRARTDNRHRWKKKEVEQTKKQREAERLKESQNTAAMLTTFNEVDMSALMELRNKHKDIFEKKFKTKLGFMSPFVKASTFALQRFPNVNGYLDSQAKEIIYRDYVDISVAVSTETGLVVPVLRNTENMSFADIENAIVGLGQKARAGQLVKEDMVGGTFTIS